MRFINGNFSMKPLCPNWQHTCQLLIFVPPTLVVFTSWASSMCLEYRRYMILLLNWTIQFECSMKRFKNEHQAKHMLQWDWAIMLCIVSHTVGFWRVSYTIHMLLNESTNYIIRIPMDIGSAIHLRVHKYACVIERNMPKKYLWEHYKLVIANFPQGCH